METATTEAATTVRTEDHGKLLVGAKCAHQACTCTTLAGELYCSDYCAEWASEQKSAGAGVCNCGHAQCAHLAAVS